MLNGQLNQLTIFIKSNIPHILTNHSQDNMRLMNDIELLHSQFSQLKDTDTTQTYRYQIIGRLSDDQCTCSRLTNETNHLSNQINELITDVFYHFNNTGEDTHRLNEYFNQLSNELNLLTTNTARNVSQILCQLRITFKASARLTNHVDALFSQLSDLIAMAQGNSTH